MDFLQLGPNKLVYIGKKMNNKFWKQVFSAVNPFMQGAVFCHPEKIFVAPLWDNPIISRNNKAMKTSAFPNLSHKMKTISDFYNPGSKTMFTKQEIENKYQIVLSEDCLLELHYIIRTTKRSLVIDESSSEPIFLPFQPLLINIANLAKKGCNLYCKFLKKKRNLSSTQSEREFKWHTELQATFGTDFWGKTYSFTAGIQNENKIKWLQYQIVRNSLYTNYKVNKFKPHISPFRTFCGHLGNSPPRELVSHIFWSCNFVQTLWQTIKAWLGTLNFEVSFDRTSLLFGNHSEDSSSVENYVILVAKYFIWKAKFTNKDLSIELFKKYLKSKLDDLKNAYAYSDKVDKFEQWNSIYVCL